MVAPYTREGACVVTNGFVSSSSYQGFLFVWPQLLLGLFFARLTCSGLARFLAASAAPSFSFCCTAWSSALSLPAPGKTFVHHALEQLDPLLEMLAKAAHHQLA